MSVPGHVVGVEGQGALLSGAEAPGAPTATVASVPHAGWFMKVASRRARPG